MKFDFQMERHTSSSHRRQEFKKGADLDESRRRRGDDIVAQRRNKREESLLKKRQTALESTPVDAASSDLNHTLGNLGTAVRRLHPPF